MSVNIFSKWVIIATFYLLFLNPFVVSHRGLATGDQSLNRIVFIADENPKLVHNHGPEILVVRVYFDSRQQLAEIAALINPWEVHIDEGYLIAGLTQNEYSRMIVQGWRIEVDHQFTEFVNRPQEYLPNQESGIPGYPCYRTIDESYTTAQEIVAKYPYLAEWTDIGDSWDKITPGDPAGYDLMLLKLSNSAKTGDKPKLFIMTALHGREYATSELSIRFAEHLVENYDIDPDITWILDYTEIHLLLQANPDGRKKAETGLLWRKNTNLDYCSSIPASFGADLNRNFEYQWGCCDGSSGNECDQTYRGFYPGSEPETKAIQDYLRAIFPDQRGESLTDPAPQNTMGTFLDIHSYGEMVLWPWGFTDSVGPNGQAMQTLGRKFAYFNNYIPNQAIALYPTDGSSDDFAYGDLGIAAFTFELGTSFFQDCSIFENAILPDNLLALRYAAKTSRTPYITPAGPDTLNLSVSPNQISNGGVVKLKATIDDTHFNNINGIETSQNIQAAEYTIDTPPWENGAVTRQMSATDNNFNSKVENVMADIDTTELETGRHTIFVRGQDSTGIPGAVSAIFITIESPNVFEINKTANTYQVVPGDVFTYSLEAQLTQSEINDFTLSLRDILPPEVDVLQESIRVNGAQTNGLYLPEKHTIYYESSGVFTDTYNTEITFQVQIKNTQDAGLEIVNLMSAEASLNDMHLPTPDNAKATVLIVNPFYPDLFLPVIVNENKSLDFQE